VIGCDYEQQELTMSSGMIFYTVKTVTTRSSRPIRTRTTRVRLLLNWFSADITFTIGHGRFKTFYDADVHENTYVLKKKKKITNKKNGIRPDIQIYGDKKN